MGERVREWLAPASEASGSDNAYTITVELPGVEEKDIDLSVDDGVVTLKGEKRTEREEKGETWFFSERQNGALTRLASAIGTDLVSLGAFSPRRDSVPPQKT